MKVETINSKTVVKQRTTADKGGVGPLVSAYEAQVAAQDQTVIAVNNFLAKPSTSKNILLFIDGKILVEDVDYSWVYLNNQVTSTVINLIGHVLNVGLPILLLKIGTRIEQSPNLDTVQNDIDTLQKLKHDTKANLLTYAQANPLIESQSAFATDELKFYQIADGDIADVSAGGSGGVGGYNIYKTFDLDNSGKLTDWTTIGDTVQSEDELTPLNGKKSFKYTQVATSAIGDRTTLSYFPVPEQATKKPMHIVKMRVRMDNCNTGDFEVNVLGVAATIRQTQVVDANTTEFQMVFGYNDADSLLALQLKVGAVNVGASITIDSVEFKDTFGEYGSQTISETITYTGYISGTTSGILLKTEKTNTGDKLIQVDPLDATRTKITFKQRATFVATANGFGGSGFGYGLLKMYNKDDVSILDSYNDMVSTNFHSQNYGLNDIAEEGDYIIYAQDTSTDNATQVNFSVTATAQSQTVQFEDSYEQGHNVGKIKWDKATSFNAPATEGRMTISGSNITQVTGRISSLDNGDYPSFRISNVKRGTLTIILDSNIVSSDTSDTANIHLMLYKDGVKLDGERKFGHTEGEGVQRASYNAGYVYSVDIDSPVDYIDFEIYASLDTGASGYLKNTSFAVSYLPPAEQATATRLLSVKQSLENDFKAFISAESVTPVVARQTQEVIESIDDNGNGDYTLNFKSGYYAEAPYLDNIQAIRTVGTGYAPHIRSLTKDIMHIQFLSDGGSGLDSDFSICLSKSGADRSDRTAAMVNGSDVVKEQVMYIKAGRVASSTSWSTSQLESLSGDIFGSIDPNTDRLTIPAGTYDFTEILGLYRNGNWLSFKVYNFTNSSDEKLYTNFIYNAVNEEHLFNKTARHMVVISTATTFEFQTILSATGAGNMGVEEIVIRKLL